VVKNAHQFLGDLREAYMSEENAVEETTKHKVKRKVIESEYNL